MSVLTSRNVVVAFAALSGSLCCTGAASAADFAKLNPATAPQIGQYVYGSFLRNARTSVTGACVYTGFWTPQTATLECDPELFAVPRPSRVQAPQPGANPTAAGGHLGAEHVEGAQQQTSTAQIGQQAHAPEQAQVSGAPTENKQAAAAAAGQSSAGQGEQGTATAQAPGTAHEAQKHAETAGTLPPVAGAGAATSGEQSSVNPPPAQPQVAATLQNQPAETQATPASSATAAPEAEHAQESGQAPVEHGETQKHAAVPNERAWQGGQPEASAAQPGAAEAAAPTVGQNVQQAAGTTAGSSGTPINAAQAAPEKAQAGQQSTQVTPQSAQAAPEASTTPPQQGRTAASPTEVAAETQAPLVLPVTVSVETAPLFGFDRVMIRADSKTELDHLVAQLKGVKYGEIMVVGYADPIGTIPYNLLLSRSRAESVKGYLESEGVPAAKIEIDGSGETEEYASLANCGALRREPMIACLQPDRRVEVTVIGANQ